MKKGWKAFIVIAIIVAILCLSITMISWEKAVIKNTVTVVDIEAVTHNEVIYHTPLQVAGIAILYLFVTLLIIMVLGTVAYLTIEC